MKRSKLKTKRLLYKAKHACYPIHKKGHKNSKRFYGRNRNMKYYNTRDSIRQIRDEKVLMDIVENHENHDCRIYAIENHNLKSERKLLKIITQQNGYVLREKAVAKLQKEENLIDLVKNHYDWHVRRQALRNQNLHNKKVFERAALNDEDYMLRREAVKHVEDEDLLVYLSRNDEDVDVRISCIRKIRNMDIIIYAAGHDSNWRVRKSAIDKIRDLEILEELLYDEKDIYIQDYLQEKIDYLKRIN